MSASPAAASAASVSPASPAPPVEAEGPAASAAPAADSPVVSDAAPAEGVAAPDVASEPRHENAHSPGVVDDATRPVEVARAEDVDQPIVASGARAEVSGSAVATDAARPADLPVSALVVPADTSAERTINGAQPAPSSAVDATHEAPRPTNGHLPTPTPARVAGRVRRRPSATPAEQAAADLALLRTFGVAHRNGADEPDVELEGCTPDDDTPVAGNAQPISFRVLGRDGRGIRGATVTLLDDHGRETANTRTNPEGHGVLTARHPGGYLLVTAAEGFQPGAITVAVTDEPVDAEIPLTRSASITGSVGGEDGPIVGAQLALVQDGEIVDSTESTAEGTYRFADLAAGEYGLSVTAHECEPAAFVLELADEAALRQDVDLVPAGLPSDDVVTAHR
jgi:hypothetical protein